MNNLINIDYRDDRPIVSARELHEFLEIKTSFKDWFPRMCEYGFVEGRDFNPLKIERVHQEGNRMVNRTVDDAALSIDMAKEISMIQRNQKGKTAREYFLQVERDWNSPEKVMARGLVIANQKIGFLEIENKRQREIIEANKPKVIFADSVAASDTSILIGELVKLLKQNGVKNMGQNRLFQWMRDNGYLIRRNGSDYNTPSQRSMEMGLFQIKETTVTHADGHTVITKTSKVTGKGQQYFINLFLSDSHNTQFGLMTD